MEKEGFSMKYIRIKNLSFLYIALTLLLFAIHSELSANDFSDADASQVVIRQLHKLESVDYKRDNRVDDPRYSPDGKQILYTKYIENQHLKYGVVPKKPVIVIRDVNTRKVVDTFTGGFAATWSPDGKHIAYCLNGKLSIFNLKSRKSVPLDYQEQEWDAGCDRKYVWAEDRFIYSSTGTVLDLETLKVTGLRDNARNEAKKWFNNAALSKHKRCYIYEYYFLVPGRGEFREQVLIVENKDESYTKVLAKDVITKSSLALFSLDDRNYQVSGYDAAPDLTSVVFSKQDGLYIAYLGLGKTPTVTFNVDLSNLDVLKGKTSRGVNGRLISSYDDFFSRFKDGGQIWGAIFSAKKNPLNGKVIGPDTKAFKGYAKFIDLAEGKSAVKITTDYSSNIGEGDVLTNITAREIKRGQGDIFLGEMWTSLKVSNNQQ